MKPARNAQFTADVIETLLVCAEMPTTARLICDELNLPYSTLQKWLYLGKERPESSYGAFRREWVRRRPSVQVIKETARQRLLDEALSNLRQQGL